MPRTKTQRISLPTVKIADLRLAAIKAYGIPAGEPFNLLAVTCGLPRAGKSTWSRHQPGAVIVDPDCVRLAFQGRPYIKETEEWIWSVTRLMVRSIFLAGHQDVIVQGINPNSNHRRQWMLNDLWYPVFCWFPTSADECLRRAKNNVRPDLEKVITSLAKSLTMPSESEGPTVIIK